jgi:hypothetical protein
MLPKLAEAGVAHNEAADERIHLLYGETCVTQITGLPAREVVSSHC